MRMAAAAATSSVTAPTVTPAAPAVCCTLAGGATVTGRVVGEGVGVVSAVMGAVVPPYVPVVVVSRPLVACSSSRRRMLQGTCKWML